VAKPAIQRRVDHTLPVQPSAGPGRQRIKSAERRNRRHSRKAGKRIGIAADA
jgi:hypothetical protein